jgi:hypothetical protein
MWIKSGVANPNWSLGRIGKKIPLLGRILTKTEGNHPKYRKITNI